MVSIPKPAPVSAPDADADSKSKSKRKRIDPKLKRHARELLHREVVDVEYPGGKSRDSIRVILKDGRSAIATKRDDLERATLEQKVLRALTKKGVPVPKLLAGKRRLLFQEDLGNQRLSQALAKADAQQIHRLLDSALTGLAQSHKAASQSGLDNEVPERGHEKQWLVGLIERPAVIGKHLEIDAPALDVEALCDQLAVRRPRFVKWDARPGNALVDDDGKVYWIDWEHSGSRNRLDDMAWLLADEYVDDSVDIENALLDSHVPAFADDLDENAAWDYLMTYGCFHSSVRLGLVLRHKKDEDWWDADYCIEKDKVGITKECALRLCRRGSRWAARSSQVRALAPWFDKVGAHIETL